MTEMEQHIQALREVRASGRINMMDMVGVMAILAEEGLWDTYSYLLKGSRVDRDKYMELLQKVGS